MHVRHLHTLSVGVILLVLGIIFLLAAVFPFPRVRINLVALGLAFWALSDLADRLSL
jgi:hypothetical protein